MSSMHKFKGSVLPLGQGVEVGRMITKGSSLS